MPGLHVDRRQRRESPPDGSEPSNPYPHGLWTYGTLPGHPESGEETFEVRRRPDGTVVATIGSVARPDWWAARLAGPLARRVQRVAVGRYARALRALAADAVSA